MHTDPVDVSVVIPTYNRLWCLPRAVASCRGTRCRTQIVVVDDGSTDGTWEWLARQPDVVAIRQPNQGQTWAVNRGLAAARGAYVRFLDSDDSLLPGTIDRQIERAIETGAQLVYSRVDEWDEASGAPRAQPELTVWDDFLAVQLGESNAGHFLGMLFRSDLLANLPRRPEFALREDRMFLLEVALRNPTIARCEGCAGYWHKHNSQMHDNYRGLTNAVAIWQYVAIYRRVLREIERRGELTQPRRTAAARVLWRLAHDAARVDLAEGVEIAQWATQLDPAVERPEGLLGRVYGTMGFRRTEVLLRLRRTLFTPLRRGRVIAA